APGSGAGGQVKPPAHLVPCQRGPRRPRVPAGWPLAAAAPPDVGLAIVEEVHQHEALRARGANAIDPPALGEEYRRVAGDAEARPGRGSAHGRRQCASHANGDTGRDLEDRLLRLPEPPERPERQQEEWLVVGGRERRGEVGGETGNATPVALPGHEEGKGDG